MNKAWEEIAARCPKDRPIKGAEVGVWFGITSAALLRALPNLYLYMIDWWRVLDTPEERNKCSVEACIGQSIEQMADALNGAKQGTTFAEYRRHVIVSECIAGTAKVPELLHFAFLDADHTYEGTRDAMRAYWPLIEPGGFLCGHDYGHPSPDWGVAEAVHEVAEELGLGVGLGVDGAWFITKPGFTS